MAPRRSQGWLTRAPLVVARRVLARPGSAAAPATIIPPLVLGLYSLRFATPSLAASAGPCGTTGLCVGRAGRGRWDGNGLSAPPLFPLPSFPLRSATGLAGPLTASTAQRATPVYTRRAGAARGGSGLAEPLTSGTKPRVVRVTPACVSRAPCRARGATTLYYFTFLRLEKPQPGGSGGSGGSHSHDRADVRLLVVPGSMPSREPRRAEPWSEWGRARSGPASRAADGCRAPPLTKAVEWTASGWPKGCPPRAARAARPAPPRPVASSVPSAPQ